MLTGRTVRAALDALLECFARGQSRQDGIHRPEDTADMVLQCSVPAASPTGIPGMVLKNPKQVSQVTQVT